jgi:hypothetical protein
MEVDRVVAHPSTLTQLKELNALYLKGFKALPDHGMSANKTLRYGETVFVSAIQLAVGDVIAIAAGNNTYAPRK